MLDLDIILKYISLTYTHSGTEPEGEEREGFDVVTIFFKKPFWLEQFRLRPELWVVVDSVQGQPDLGAFRNLEAGKLLVILPVLHTHPVSPSYGPIQPQIF